MLSVSVAVLAAALSTTPALAQSAQAPQQNAALSCSSGGLTYRVGEYACIPACHGARRLARCDVEGSAVQQVTWTYISDVCPSAMIINPPWPEDWNTVPVQTNMSPIPVAVKMSAIDPMIAPKVGSRWEQAAVVRSITH